MMRNANTFLHSPRRKKKISKYTYAAPFLLCLHVLYFHAEPRYFLWRRVLIASGHLQSSEQKTITYDAAIRAKENYERYSMRVS